MPFEPVYLVPDGPAQLSEYGKRWLDEQRQAMAKHQSILLDVLKLGEKQLSQWEAMQRLLELEGCPTAVTNGISQYGMSHLVDHINGHTSFTMPTTIAICLATTAPTSTTTAVTIVETAYTGYTRESLTSTTWSNAATAATPSVATNNGAITFPACTGTGSTLLGFMVADNATLATGNSLWYGTLTSTAISTTQTPPTIATTVMSLSMTGS